MRPRGSALLAVTAALLGTACPPTRPYPGTELVGNFHFTATQVAGGCPFTDSSDGLPDGSFAFDATLSRGPDPSQAWLTLNGYNRVADFDGQVVGSTQTAPRSFFECPCSTVAVTEVFNVALLSHSQAMAAGGGCPSDPLDGGVPAPTDGGTADSGIIGPGTGPDGFDALLACGVLVDAIAPADAGCATSCQPCTLTYALSGTRS